MKLTDEQIASIMTKNSLSKTVLVDNEKAPATIKDHEKGGWKLHKQSEIGDKIKLTFLK